MTSSEAWGARTAERAAMTAFRRAFEGEAVVTARAPGRVVLVGEDTCGSEGLVLAIAMEREVRIVARPREDAVIRLVSEEEGPPIELDAAPGSQAAGAPDVAAVARVGRVLRDAGHEVRGFDGAVVGHVPRDLALASSTAAAVAAGVLLRAISELDLDDPTLAGLCARADAEAPESRGAVADALSALVAQAGSAVLVDCLDLTHRIVPLPRALRVVVLDLGAGREPAAGAYARRREEGEAALAAIGEHDPEASSLRDVTPEELERWEERLPPPLARRVRHIVGENERVKLAAAALEQNETERFGELIFAAHRSLRDDGDLEAPELDALVELARGAPGMVGARMLGSGRGTVNVVAAAWVDEFIERVRHRSQERFGVRPETYVTAAGAGAQVARIPRG